MHKPLVMLKQKKIFFKSIKNKNQKSTRFTVWCLIQRWRKIRSLTLIR